MLGRTHALTGAVAWLAGAPAVSAAVGTPLGGLELAAGTLLCAGAALVPDLDEPKAAVARRLPAGQAGAAAVKVAAGGHRQLTHSLAFAALATAATWALVTYATTAAVGVVCGLLVFLGAWTVGAAVGLRTLRVLVGALLGIGLGAAITHGHVTAGGWVTGAVALGVILHIAGDAITPGGVPLLAPFSRWRLAVPVLSVGGPLERVTSIALTVALVWFGSQAIVP